ncbi:hypothetical protein I7I53_05079 [Histoplasma capsulatum var. duboisii H88]|uniref:Uncharacterized protein n=1 Tax=Ajellomyces capsulatus (strain H88) TaxID=544711 RepID=A0A8A1LUC8_AJEC8|nr:hypothetical protein I7I53_05079 [Histoplasma capsulatum var. duboisii H88]
MVQKKHERPNTSKYPLNFWRGNPHDLKTLMLTGTFPVSFFRIHRVLSHSRKASYDTQRTPHIVRREVLIGETQQQSRVIPTPSCSPPQKSKGPKKEKEKRKKGVILITNS